MLVLSRKRLEKLIINSDIVITIVEIRKNVVRLGITAPDSVKVVRAELIHEQSHGTSST